MVLLFIKRLKLEPKGFSKNQKVTWGSRGFDVEPKDSPENQRFHKESKDPMRNQGVLWRTRGFLQELDKLLENQRVLKITRRFHSEPEWFCVKPEGLILSQKILQRTIRLQEESDNSIRNQQVLWRTRRFFQESENLLNNHRVMKITGRFH